MESLDDLIDESHAGVRIHYGIAKAELEMKAIVRATAATYLAVYDVLHEARSYPELFVPLGAAADEDAAEFAMRAAIADLAVRMSVAENTIRAYEHTAAILMARAPRVWAMFREGDISVANVRVVTDFIGSMPDALWNLCEDAALASAQLAPARFRTRMRMVRERIQPDLAERHRAALDERRMWLERDIDGMSSVGVYGPAAACEQAVANVDRIAHDLASRPDETRTLAQLRADVALRLLAGAAGSGKAVNLTVGLTIPIMTMLGHSDEPAVLRGYGPIDAGTARELARDATSFTRILTHPITGAIIDVDNPGYRPTVSQDRTVKTRDQVCTMPGCSKPAENCDLDHTIPWPNGPTSYANLKALCRNHHRLKHKTLWKSVQDADGNTTWTSPTGFVRPADPPPF